MMMTRYSTRLLMICAAIGVAGGVVYAVNAYVGGTVVAALPMFYGAIIAVYFLPGAIAQALLQRPMVAILTSLVAALVSLPVQPNFARALGGALLVGGLQEAVFALTRYRYWRTWVFVLSSAVAGLVIGVALHIMLNLSITAPWVQITQLVASTCAPVLATLLGIAVARAVARTGVARGVSRDLSRTHDTE